MLTYLGSLQVSWPCEDIKKKVDTHSHSLLLSLRNSILKTSVHINCAGQCTLRDTLT